MKTDVVKLVTFQLGLDLFGADVLSVDRVLRYSPPNCVPDVPSWIEGVIEHRGKVVPVVDLRRRVELSDDSITPETRILVLNTSQGWVGAIVDMVHEVAMVPASSVSPPPPLFRGLSARIRSRHRQGPRPARGGARRRPRADERRPNRRSINRRRPERPRFVAERPVDELRARQQALDARLDRPGRRGRARRAEGRDRRAVQGGRAGDRRSERDARRRAAARREVEGRQERRCRRSRRSSSATGRACTRITSARRPSSRRGGARSRRATTPARSRTSTTRAATLAQRSAGRIAARLGADAAGQVRRRAAELPESAGPRAAERAGANQRRLHLSEEGDFRRGDRASVARDPPRQRQEGDAVRALLSGPGLPRAGHVRGCADVLPEDDRAGTESDRGVLRVGAGVLVQRSARRSDRDVEGRLRGEQVQSVGQALCRSPEDRGERRRTLGASRVGAAARARACGRVRSHGARGRSERRTRRSASIAGDSPRCSIPRERALATSLLDGAVRERHVPRACRDRDSACFWRSRRTAAISRVGRSGRAGVGRGDHLSRVAADRDAGAVERKRRRAIRAKCSGTSSRTSRCTNRSATCRRAGSTRATPAFRRANGIATTRSRRTSRLALRGTPTFDELDREFGGGIADGAERVRAGLSRGRRTGGAGHGRRAITVLQ